MRRTCRIAPLAALAVCTGAVHAQPYTYRPIAVSGEIVPTAGGPATIVNPASGVTLPDGRIVLRAVVQRGTSFLDGLWIGAPGDWRSLALSLDPVPGIPGYFFALDGFGWPMAMGGGQALLNLGIRSLSTETTQSVWRISGDSLECIAARGMQVQGIASAVYYAASSPSPGPDASIYIAASMMGPGISGANDTALLCYEQAGARVVAREGDPAPGVAAGITLGTPDFRSLTPDRRVVFGSTLHGPGMFEGSNAWSIYREDPGGHELIYLQRTTQPPGLGDGAVFSQWGPTFNRAGTAAGRNILEGPAITAANDSGIWSWDGEYHQLLREGQLLGDPPSQVSIGQVGWGYLCEDGTTFGRAVLNSLQWSGEALFRIIGGLPSVILRQNTQAPGLPAGVMLQLSHGPANRRGEMVMLCPLAGAGVSPGNNLALYFVDAAGNPRPILRKGDLFEHHPGQFAPVSFSFANPDRSMLSESGVLIFPATFGGPDSGLYAVSLSCPVNCDESTLAPLLNIADFTCFLQRFAAGDQYANCDGSTTEPVLNVADFSCFLGRFAAGCP